MVQVCSESYECKVSAKRMWHGLFKDAHSCLPKAFASKVLAIEYPLGQHGFELLGHERIIKLHKVIGDKVHKVEDFVHKEEAFAKEEVAKVDCGVHKEALLLKKTEEEVAAAAHKEACFAKEKVEEVGGAAHKGADLIKEEVGCAAHEAAKITKEVIHKEAEVAHKAVEIPEKILHKEAEEAHKVVEIVEKLLHKEEVVVGELLQHEELWIKEKIEEVDHAAFKIVISVIAGGLIGILLKHCKHTFEIKDTIHEGGVHGSILHWTSEFETLSKTIDYLHCFEKLKKHAFGTFSSVEAYLLKHDDYTT